jgi:hypothetical protein
MPFYPIWSLTCIAIGVLVISALASYGGRAEAYSKAWFCCEPAGERRCRAL